MLSRLLSHKGKKKKENPKAGTATNDHINYPLNSNHNLVSGYAFSDSSFTCIFLGFFLLFLPTQYLELFEYSN